jgi:aspartate racemase
MKEYHMMKMAKKLARREKPRTIGILGGMGPEATAYFFDLIIKNTRAAKDQDHVPVIVVNLPAVPDRTAAILRSGPSPLPLLVHGVKVLHKAGAHFAVIPCVTAHYFHHALAARAPIPVIDLLEETAAEVGRHRPRTRKLGLIASDGTVVSRIVHDAFSAVGIEVLVPAARDQKRVTDAIYGKKGIKAGVTAGPPRKAILDVAAGLVRAGAQGIVAGCTEVPLVLGEDDLPVPLIDPMRIGARACIRKAGGRTRAAGRPGR